MGYLGLTIKKVNITDHAHGSGLIETEFFTSFRLVRFLFKWYLNRKNDFPPKDFLINLVTTIFV